VAQVEAKARGEARFTAYLQAFLGFMFLLFSAAGVEAYLRGQTSPGVAAMITLGFLFCGVIALFSAWLLYRFRTVAASFYAASWATIILGWLALNLMTDSPLWLTGLVALMFVYRAVQQTMTLRRDLQTDGWFGVRSEGE
jgi:hypothetical protein